MAITKHCNVCGSDNVMLDIGAVWNMSAECWEMIDIDDDAVGECQDCEARFRLCELVEKSA
jgi:hypothetical protein